MHNYTRYYLVKNNLDQSTENGLRIFSISIAINWFIFTVKYMKIVAQNVLSLIMIIVERGLSDQSAVFIIIIIKQMSYITAIFSLLTLNLYLFPLTL